MCAKVRLLCPGVDVPSKRQPSQQLVKTATGKQACKGRSENTAPASPGPASEAAAPAKRDVTLHPVYGAPPDPDAEVTMVNGKPMWQYMNDKGEEVTVVRPAAHHRVRFAYRMPELTCRAR